MKVTMYCFMMVFLMSTVISKADYTPVEEICVGVSGNQIRPDIDGDIVIWEDGLDIYWLDLSDPNLIQHPIIVGGVQDYAAVGGQSVVWRDKNTDYDIGIYDIQSHTDWILSSNDGSTQRYPEASSTLSVKITLAVLIMWRSMMTKPMHLCELRRIRLCKQILPSIAVSPFGEMTGIPSVRSTCAISV